MTRLPFFLSLALLACTPKPPPETAATTPPPPPPPLPAYAQAMVDAMDPSASACDDFYQYACGGWLKSTPLPADKPAWTRSFSAIADENRQTLKAILEDAAARAATTSDENVKKIGNFYGSCMAVDAVNAAGLAPLGATFAEIDKVKDVKGFATQVGRLQALGVGALVSMWVDGDYKDPGRAILYLSEGGLSLPDRDYYLKDDEGTRALLAAFEGLVASQLERSGMKAADAKKQAAAVLAFERAIAELSVPREELRDPDKTYHKIDRVGVLKNSPGLKWDLFLAAAGAGTVNDIVVETPEVFQKLDKLVAKTPAATLRAYLRWQTLHTYAPFLDDTTYQADFDFFGRQVVGQKEPEVRWKRCVRATDRALGEAVAEAFVTKKFAGDSKTTALTMIAGIETAFAQGLPHLAWMDGPTRDKAILKSKQVTNKIGYPDKWRDYTALSVEAGKLADHAMAANRFENLRQLAKVGQPVDRGEWYMTPPTVNAYYNPTQNEMVFPAGILQPPFFRADYPTAMNYGGIGMVMGHELTHGFDDQGRKFDGEGKLSEWWPPEVAAGYEKRAECVKTQFDAFEVAPGLHVKGALTLGENIADLGGTRQAFRAWQAVKDSGKKAEIPGMTEEQVFFLAMAQGWCTVAAPEWEKMLVLSNPHSPSKYRVNGPLQNLPEFAEAFHCAEGTAMHPRDRCEVW